MARLKKLVLAKKIQLCRLALAKDDLYVGPDRKINLKLSPIVDACLVYNSLEMSLGKIEFLPQNFPILAESSHNLKCQNLQHEIFKHKKNSAS